MTKSARSVILDVVLLSFFLYAVLSPVSLMPFVLEVILAGVALLAFLFPRDGFSLSSQDLSPAKFWQRVMASKSGMRRLLVLLALLIYIGVVYEVPHLSSVFASFFHAAPQSIVDRSFVEGFSMLWTLIVPLCFSLGLACSYGLGRILLPRRANEERKQTESRMQRWADSSMFCFNAAFLLALAGISFSPKGPVTWFASWLVSSGLDANLPKMADYIAKQINIYDWGYTVIQPEVNGFVVLIRVFALMLMSILLWRPSNMIGQLLTSFVKRKASSHAAVEAFMGAWRLPAEDISIKARRSLLRNSFATLGWLLACYLTIFGIFGFSSGPLANAIMGWMDASVLDAGFRLPRMQKKFQTNSLGEAILETSGNVFFSNAVNINTRIMPGTPRRRKVVFLKNGLPMHGSGIMEVRRTVNETPELRIFLASIIALYGTAPLAITACVFLPYSGRRRLRINDEGVILPATPLGLLSPFRLWSDLKSMELAGKEVDLTKRWLVFKFFSGKSYRLRVNQITPEGIERLLAAIDEYAQYCIISAEVLALRAEMKRQVQKTGTSQEKEFRSLSAAAFTSTVFVPAESGEMLPANTESGETFRVVRQLSSKPLAVVYLVRRSNGELAIVKQFFLAEDTPEAHSMRRYFEREYKVLSQLSHPRIAKVIDCYTNGESSFLVLEYFRGADLRRIVRDSGLQLEHIVRRWAKQLAGLMVYLHSQEPAVLHRDLSPDNIVLADDGQISLIDFGAAHQFLEHITGTMIGKKCYVAPEQLRGHAAVSSDIYSFGCTLHFLLTGCDPVALSECRPSSKIMVSREFDELVLACTNFDAEKRPKSFEQILRILDGKESFNLNELPPLAAGELERDPLLEKFASICQADQVSKAEHIRSEVESELGSEPGSAGVSPAPSALSTSSAVILKTDENKPEPLSVSARETEV